MPLTDTDSQDLAGDASDYTATTEWTFLDIVINLFTQWVTITSREMTVTK